MTTQSLAGQAAVVTGAGAGIGRGVALALARAGASVTLVDVVGERLDQVAREFTAAGGRCTTICVDLSDHHAVQGLVEQAVSAWGRLDILVNNAATTGRRLPLAEVTHDEWLRVVNTNLTAPLILSRDAAGAMAAQGGGCIVNVSSVQAYLPLETHVCYVTSKGGLEALTRALAVELGPQGIRVNAVAPGVIATEQMRVEHPDWGTDSGREQATVSGRAGSEDDVAATVLFLVSAAHVTGTTVTVDGGRRVSRKPDPSARNLQRRTATDRTNWPRTDRP